MSAVERVRDAYRRIGEADRPEVWIALRPLSEALDDAARVDASVRAGAVLSLAGATLAVKDNIDVAGLPTTAGCPAFAYVPAASAPAVQRLCEAGAVVLGKTNLDQFATGLVGTRSPYGAVRDARRPDHVSGGSSSGSAVAVALGLADLGLGTDTAGSGRVPAAFQGIVGVKPTRGLVPTAGVVPACRTLDCVTVFARELGPARDAAALMTGPHADDPTSRARPADAPLAAPARPRVGVPGDAALAPLTPAARTAFAAAAERMGDAGAELVAVDVEPFLAAGRLLYGGAFVAERHAAVGAFVERNRAVVDATVGAIVVAAGRLSASALVADGERLDRLRLAARAVLAPLDALLLPTVPRQPTIAAVARDPLGENTRLGVYANCANLLDLCGVAVPAGEADGGCFGVTLLAPAFHDDVVADVARLLGGAEAPRAGRRVVPPTDGVELFVVGAHLAGQPLNHQLTDRGAAFARAARTAPDYRLHRLATSPPKPGLERVARGGTAIAGELWRLPAVGLATLLAQLPQPMALGSVVLEDGSACVGFLCEPAALTDAIDITVHGSWPRYLESVRGRATSDGD